MIDTKRRWLDEYFNLVPGDPLIGELMRQGGTIYRKYDHGVVLVVPAGASHSAAWRSVMGH